MFVASTLALLLAAPTDTYTIQWKLKEGDVFYNKAKVVIDQTIEAMGNKVDQKIETDTVLRFRVKSAKRDATVVEMTYVETKIETQGLPVGDTADKMKGATFIVTLDSKMKVTKFEGYDKFLDALTDGDDAKKKLMRSIMPESMLRRSFDQTFLFAPDKPVAVGDKWDNSQKMPLGPLGTMNVKYQSKLDSVKGDIATITTKGDVEWKGNDAETDAPFKVSKADVKAEKFSSNYQFNLKTGRPQDSKMEMTLGGTMTIELGGMSIDMKIKQKMTTTGVVTDKNPVKD